MNLTTARLWVRDGLRSGGDTTQYANDQVDRAILTIGNRFCRLTQCLPTVNDLALTAEDPDLPSFPATFAPWRILKAWLSTGEPINILDYQELAALRLESPSSGTPTHLAFSTATAGEVWPTPSATATLKLRWWQPFSGFTPGTASPDAVTLNLPDEILAEILPFGPPAIIQGVEPEHAFASACWAKYLEVERGMKPGGLGPRVAGRDYIEE